MIYYESLSINYQNLLEDSRIFYSDKGCYNYDSLFFFNVYMNKKYVIENYAAPFVLNKLSQVIKKPLNFGAL